MSWDDDDYNPWGKMDKCKDNTCGGNDKCDDFDFDHDSVLLHKIIKALCILKREIDKCEEILCNPKFGLKEIKREVRNIERAVFSPTFGLEEIKVEVSEILDIVRDLEIPTFLLADIKSEVSAIESAVFNPTFGLEEIKSEVSMIETIVGGIMDMIDNPTFGLEEIKIEVSDILAIVTDIVLNPVFGISEIKAEVSNIENAVFSPTFGLEEIKAEVSQILANQGVSPFLTTGPFFVDCEEQTLHLKALNNTNVTQSVTFTVRNLMGCPVTMANNIFLTIPACCGTFVEVALPGIGERNIEVRAQRSSAIGVLVYLATKTALPNCQGSRVNEFKHAEWVPVATFCT
ncbi:MAG: hypothetical protein ACOY35_11755 [Bacillota bacterium]